MSNPLVSIVICCYNRADLLPITMETVFAQQYQPVEIVVIDDGSTDNTPELMAGYGDKVRYYHKEDEGISKTRTEGCKLAQGEYIAFQDDDDLMPPERIGLLLNAMKHYPDAVLALGDYAFISPDGELTGEKSHFEISSDYQGPITKPILLEDGYSAILWPKVTPLPHTTLFKRADAEQIGWFDHNFFHACSDTDFFARLGQLGPIVYVPEVVSYYRWGHSSIWKKKLIAEYSRFMLLEKHIKISKTENLELFSRLQGRLLATLNRLALLEMQTKGHDVVPNDYLKRGLKLLNRKEQFAYWRYRLLRLPLRLLLKGSNTEN